MRKPADLGYLCEFIARILKTFLIIKNIIIIAAELLKETGGFERTVLVPCLLTKGDILTIYLPIDKWSFCV